MFPSTGPDLVPHDGEVIHPQFTGVHCDFAQSLSSVGVQQDPEPLALLVEGADSPADLLDGLRDRGPQRTSAFLTH